MRSSDLSADLLTPAIGAKWGHIAIVLAALAILAANDDKHGHGFKIQGE